MNVKEFDYDLKMGFAWIVIEDSMSVQCCLNQEQLDNDNETRYNKLIIASDCGHDWGLSGDNNAAAFKKWGENRCMKSLFSHAEKNGIDVIF